jgi:peptide-methionine (S)-S-oxide reductase
MLLSCGSSGGEASVKEKNWEEQNMKTDTAIFGTGCFWCSEAAFSEMRGVISAISGYAGGNKVNPTYEEVCTGTTGHAEVVQVIYDPDSISFQELLEVFWKIHDPTTLNRQGPDIGTQYRSVIFYYNDEQKRLAIEYKAKLDRSGAFDKPVVTEIAAFTNFYRAEDYHQGYFKKNPYAGYCQIVIRPKMDKFRKVFGDKLKKGK